MKILIIGGTGLISTAVTQQLIDRGEEVTLFNRGLTPSRFTGSCKLLVGDRTERDAFSATIREAGPWDCVIDMICSDPDDASALAEGCRGCATQVIFCSTTNVYAKPPDSYPVREDHRFGVTYKNGIDKGMCEVLHRGMDKNGGYALTIIRPGHTYGEGGNILHSLGNTTAMLDRIRHGKALVVHGDGNGLWSALHADDVAAIFAAAAGNPVAYGRTYNACGTEWMTWDQYYAGIAAAMSCQEPELVHIPAEVLGQLAPTRAAQVLRSLQYPGIYDMSAAQRELGFTQSIPFVEGVRRTIGWLADHDGIASWQSDPEYDTIIDRWRAMPAI